MGLHSRSPGFAGFGLPVADYLVRPILLADSVLGLAEVPHID